jgi:poly-beta-1,6-N-acetyl-D-glucosamine synthase
LLSIALTCAAWLAAIWVVYPLLIAIVAVISRRRRDHSRTPRPRVSVILATREDDEAIRARVADIARGTYPSELLEIVVGLDAQRTVSDVAVLAAPGVSTRVVSGDQPGGKAATLNAAVRAASGEILVFTDTAQRFAPDAIPALVDALADPRFGAVSGMLEIPSSGGGRPIHEWYWLFERRLREFEGRVHSAVGVTGAIYAMRRQAWATLPAGLILDDLYAPMQVVLRGLRVGFTPAAVAIDERRFGTGQEYARKVRTLTGVLQLCMWLPAVLVPIRNPIWLQFVFHKLLRLLTPYLLAVMVVALVAALPGLAARIIPGSAWLVMGILAALALVLPALSRRVRGILLAGLSLQAAVVHATLNGIRGRWNVWQR